MKRSWEGLKLIKRIDGRKFDELRPIEAETGVIPRADGSARFKIGNTEAIAAVYGPRGLYPKFLQSQEGAILRCYYNMMSFSGSGERVRPGPSRRSKEINLITEKALFPVLDLSEFPGSTVEVYIELLQTDAGTRCAGINAAAMALADAGFQMRDIVSAVSIGRIGNQIVADLNNEEEHHEQGSTDIPIAMLPRTGEISLFQMDGFIKQNEIQEVLKTAKKAIIQIAKVQQEALKLRYKK